ncbi:hypothetical protein J2W55_003240 [Mucilaginibacter pocheonensis]|uniref:Uncharacterized protein n=1 Tax=Mucilaginibacter pocheonensis TaxID=398050 RepID=A0ABU1TDC1_9SPHI|nr:hypothetical protein [Mucilaginibacter pocheonensis]
MNVSVSQYQQQQRIQIQLIVKLVYCIVLFADFVVLLVVNLIKLFMVINLYSPGLFSGTGIGTFSNSEGCQRVIEPDLSPLLYKSKPELTRRIDHGIATKYCFKDKVILVKIPN